MATKVPRINVTLSEGARAKLDLYAVQLGISRSKLATLSIELGLEAVRLSKDPEKASLFEKIALEYEDQVGVSVDETKIPKTRKTG